MPENQIQILNKKSEEQIRNRSEYNKQAENKREKYRKKAFGMMIQLAVIIAIPAFLGLWLGKKIDTANDSGNTYTLICLAVAFVISWVIIIVKYIKFEKEIKRIEDGIRKNES